MPTGTATFHKSPQAHASYLNVECWTLCLTRSGASAHRAGVANPPPTMKPSPPPIPIAHPCQADWHAMTGDDRRRLCALCDKHVHNLSALAPRDLERFVQNRDGTECIAYVVREDGTMVTTPRWEPVRKLAGGIVWLLAFLLPTLFSGCAQRMAASGSKMLRGTPVPGRQATPIERTVYPSGDGKMLLGEVPTSPRTAKVSRIPAARP